MQVAPFSEALKAVQCLTIAVGSAMSSRFIKHRDVLTEEAEDTLLAAVCLFIFNDYVISRIVFPAFIK